MKLDTANGLAGDPPNEPNEEVIATRLTRQLGLRRVESAELTIRRLRRGRGFAYVGPRGAIINDARLISRLAKVAVPPAYKDVFYATDPAAHLQAIGRDAAGRLQYRYHPDWARIRERRKAERLLRLIHTLPRTRRAVTQHLAPGRPGRAFALAAVVELVSTTFIRAGGEKYFRANGTSGAVTLLKSHVAIEGFTVTLSFRAKGGKPVDKTIAAPRLAGALTRLLKIPGRRVFQYRDPSGCVHRLRARDVNAYLRKLASADISLKDFRTLCASSLVLDRLARIKPAASCRGRRKQVLEAIREAADVLANTPAICRKSYVHETLVSAFENGTLEQFSPALNGSRTPSKRERLVAKVLASEIAAKAAPQTRQDLLAALRVSVKGQAPQHEARRG